MTAKPPEYDDLQLRIEREGDGSYRVLALGPQGRTGRGTFMPPISNQELDRFVQRVGLARRARGASDTRMDEIRDVGSKLFDALLKDQVADVYHAAKTAAQENGRGLRINLRLSGAPELMRLPWEFLYRRPRFLSMSMGTPLVRSLDLESARRPQKVELPLRILAVVSSPRGYPELNAADERRKMERALSVLSRDGRVDLQWLKTATLGELGRRIAQPDDIHVLHYIGHGAYDEATESGILVLETAQGRAHDVSGEDLGAMLQDEQSLRLVILNSCEGARTSSVDPFSGIATSLMEFDIPAVIGMQFEITDEAAIAFSDSMYSGLAQGLPVDAALAPARRAIVGVQKEPEFGTPVLFLRAANAAHLFEIEHVPTRASPSPESTEHGGGWMAHSTFARESRRSTTTISLQLEEMHAIVLVSAGEDEFVVDQETIFKKKLIFAPKDEIGFTLNDGGVMRDSAMRVSFKRFLGKHRRFYRVAELKIDGVDVPVEEGRPPFRRA